MPTPRVYKTEALVLRQLDFGEADRIVTLVTPEYGKYRAIAKGARKPTSRLAGAVDLITRAQFVLAQGRELDVITQGVTAERFDALRESFWHASAGYAVVEALDRALEDRAAHADVYRLALATLRRLDADAHAWLPNQTMENPAGPVARGWGALRYFELRFLDALGYRPNFQTCVACETALEAVEHNGFNAELGGALCPACSRYAQRRLALPTLKVLRHMQRTPWDALPAMRLDASIREDVAGILQSSLALALDRSLRSWSYLHMSAQS